MERTTITCTECGKIKGHGQVGDHWICADCRMEKYREQPANSSPPCKARDE